MKTLMSEHQITGTVIRGIEEAVDSANLLALDLAIKAFESDTDIWDHQACDGKTFKCMAERGLYANGMIERMMNGLDVS